MPIIIENRYRRFAKENPKIMNIGDMYHRPGLGLTQAQYGVLVILANEPGIDQTQLAYAMGFDKVTTLRVLRGLQTRGLVQRRASAKSRKHLALDLSPEGKQLLRRAQRPTQAAYERLMAPLSATQQQQLMRLLLRLSDSLNHEARATLRPVQNALTNPAHAPRRPRDSNARPS